MLGQAVPHRLVRIYASSNAPCQPSAAPVSVRCTGLKRLLAIRFSPGVVAVWVCVFVSGGPSVAQQGAVPSSWGSLSGVLSEAGSGKAIVGARVTLLDTEGVVAGEVLSSSNGTFELRELLPGGYKLQVDRLGYEPWESDVVEVVGGATSLVLRLEVPIRPIPMPDLFATTQSECPASAGDRRQALEMYESVKPKLERASSSEDLGVIRTRVIRQVRKYRGGASSLTLPVGIRRPLLHTGHSQLHPRRSWRRRGTPRCWTIRRRCFMHLMGRR